MPKWANTSKIIQIYEQAESVKQTVDHIVPLLGKTVCGLHCEDNLTIMDRIENIKKGNRYWPDMWAA